MLPCIPIRLIRCLPSLAEVVGVASGCQPLTGYGVADTQPDWPQPGAVFNTLTAMSLEVAVMLHLNLNRIQK